MSKFFSIKITRKFIQVVGFTLLEILVAISIVVILFTIGIIQYMNFNRLQILEQSTQELKNNLRLAQTMAFTGQKPSGCNSLDGYRVRFSSANPDSYIITALCGGLEIGEKKTFNLPSMIKFSPLPPPILFKVLSQGTTLTDDLTIFLAGFGQLKTIKVSKAGKIE